MARPVRTAMAAILVALAAAACSGSDGGTAAQTLPPGTSTPSGTPTSPAASSSSAPEPDLPAGVRADITVPKADDAARSALLRDWKAGQVAYLAAAAVPDPRSREVARYYAREALATTVGTLQNRAKNRRGVVGTRKIGTVTVQSQSPTAAAMSWCVDDSKFFAKDLKTGKPIINHDNDFYRVRGQLLLDPKLKIWVLVRAFLAEEDVRC